MMAGLQFYFEGLFRSRLLPIFVLGAILCAAALIPFTDKLPLSVQRSLSVVPGIHIDPRAEMDAEGSTDWRIQLWSRSWPEVPSHLLLGRGYAIDPTALEMMNTYSMRATTDSTEAFYLAGDYHSGPLSVILTFGIPGTLAFLAFLYGSIKVLYKNYLHGPPELKKINTLLLTAFISKTIFFWGAFGSLYSDLTGFTALIGLSVALNGGVCVPALAPVFKPVFKRFRLVNATASQ
jgi:O-antigen ligase